jgi:hypothetical protein
MVVVLVQEVVHQDIRLALLRVVVMDLVLLGLIPDRLLVLVVQTP